MCVFILLKINYIEWILDARHLLAVKPCCALGIMVVADGRHGGTERLVRVRTMVKTSLPPDVISVWVIQLR